MFQRNGADSPSPESQTEVLSYRSSRAGSEAPERGRDSLAHTPKSCRSSRVGSEVSQRQLERNSLCSSSQGGQLLIDGMIAYDEIPKEEHYSGSRRRRWKRDTKYGTLNAAVLGEVKEQEEAVDTRPGIRSTDVNEASEIEKALYHSVPHPGALFTLSQKLCYPFDAPGMTPKDLLTARESPDVINDDSSEYEAMGEPHITNGMEAGASRSVLRQSMDTVDNNVSTIAMCMMPDPVHESPVLALCVGDLNGRVSYSELPVHQMKFPQTSPSMSRPSKSNMSTSSRSQTDADLASIHTSLFSDRFILNSDVLGCQRPPVRGHSHQAYVREMDCLTSVAILQSVKTLRFLRSHESPNTVSYLTSNERVIKLFQVRRKGFSPFDAFASMEAVVGRRLASTHYFPRVAPSSPILPVRVFSGYHANPVQGLSICSDGQSFLSVDDLQVFWWSLEGGTDSSKATCIADCRPLSGRMDEVEELVTAAAFHPEHSSLFLVSRSSGVLGIGDLRDPISGSKRQYATSLRVTDNGSLTSSEQYCDILCSISDADFLGPNHVVTRDYLSLKLWDLRRPDAPCSSASVMGHVTPYLDGLYENDAIFDRFPIVVDHISGTVVTGLYDGAAAVWQPLHEGQINAEDVLVYYRVDPLALHCEVENGGRTTVKALSASFERDWPLSATTLQREEVREEKNHDVLPEPVANKVMCVSIADGGERFALTCTDGRCIFIFERRVKTNSLA